MTLTTAMCPIRVATTGRQRALGGGTLAPHESAGRLYGTHQGALGRASVPVHARWEPDGARLTAVRGHVHICARCGLLYWQDDEPPGEYDTAMTPPNAKPMDCIDCGMRIQATIQQAKRHGWVLWVGGARCKQCAEDQDARVIPITTLMPLLRAAWAAALVRDNPPEHHCDEVKAAWEQLPPDIRALVEDE